MPDSSTIEDERQWVEKIRSGDEVAFEALFRTYHDVLCDFVERQIQRAIAPYISNGKPTST